MEKQEIQDKFEFRAHIKSHSVKSLVSLDKSLMISLQALDVERKQMDLARWLLTLPANNECLITIVLKNDGE